MINEYCHRCCEITSMTANITEKEEKNNNGEKIKILTTSYQCNKCNIFIKSDDKTQIVAG